MIQTLGKFMINMNNIITTDLLTLGTSVKIIDADVTGKVDAIIYERTGISYRIKWWYNNTRTHVWCLPDEIEIND